MEPVLVFLLVIVIGIVVGIGLQRMNQRGWLTRQFAGGRADVTAALVGVAGAFIGFHVMALAGVISTLLVLLGALIGALIVVFLWRGGRL